VKEEIDRKLIKGLIGGQRAQFGWGEFDPLTANSIWIGKGKHIKNYTFLHTVGIDASQRRLPTPIGGSGGGGHMRKVTGGRGRPARQQRQELNRCCDVRATSRVYLVVVDICIVNLIATAEIGLACAPPTLVLDLTFMAGRSSCV